jgi:hypothetical protein
MNALAVINFASLVICVISSYLALILIVYAVWDWIEKQIEKDWPGE